MSIELAQLLVRSSARHGHLCPKQVLGVRIALSGMSMLKWRSPVTKDDGLIILETDGCFADGIQVATGATVGHRTLRVQDLGKIAATFTDLKTGTSLRLAPALDIRSRALLYASEEKRRYYAQLKGYQRMPAEELFSFQTVELQVPLAHLLSRPNMRKRCSNCGEEVINEREVVHQGKVLCQTCAHGGYYLPK